MGWQRPEFLNGWGDAGPLWLGPGGAPVAPRSEEPVELRSMAEFTERFGPLRSNHYAGMAMDVTVPGPRWLRPVRPRGFALWGARKGWVQIGSLEDRAWCKESRRPRWSDPGVNMAGAARFFAERFGLRVPSTMHVHVGSGYRSVVAQAGLYRLWRSGYAGRLAGIKTVLDDVGRAAEEVQWAWPSS